MPNWCEHDLYLSGPFAERERFLDPLRDGTGWLQHYYPRPPELENCVVPIQIVPTQYEAERINAESPRRAAISEQTAKDLTERYGAYEWYDWSVKHWGCKWGVSCLGVIRQDQHTTQLYGVTPWTPPVPGLVAVSRQFPQIVFHLDFFESAMSFTGYATVKDGAILAEAQAHYQGTRGGFKKRKYLSFWHLPVAEAEQP
jgi:hypothetical protein